MIGTIYTVPILLYNKAMNENINLVEILKDAPKGTKLWSPIFGECEFVKILSVGICQIQVKHTEGNTYHFYNFTPEGKFSNDFEAECLLFPSKGNRDWSTFKAHWMHKHFEPGQKVLVPYCDGTIYKWRLAFCSHYDESSKHHMTTDAMCFPDEEVIAYKGNENKLGKPVNE